MSKTKIHEVLLSIFVLLQDQYSPSSLFLSFASSCETDSKELHEVPRSWPSQLRGYCLSIVDRRKSFLPLSPSQEIFVSGKLFKRLLPLSMLPFMQLCGASYGLNSFKVVKFICIVFKSPCLLLV